MIVQNHSALVSVFKVQNRCFSSSGKALYNYVVTNFIEASKSSQFNFITGSYSKMFKTISAHSTSTNLIL
jgi:hypothetical protein